MLMSMLHAGGIPTTADPPGFEDGRVELLPRRSEWVHDAAGHAVKFLDPHRWRPPFGPRYLVLWLTRDPTEQARSFQKFVHHLDPDARPRALPRVRASIVHDSHAARRAWYSVRGLVHELAFEHVLADPRAAAVEVSRFIGRPFDVDRAAAAIVNRPADCLAEVHDVEIAETSARQVAEHDRRVSS